MSSGKEKGKPGGFGTFGGVFTPCTLTILGVIMFLRFGQVVGNTGVIWCVVIVLLSKIITTLTTLSLSAIATNTRVQGGGAYFLISRSLGVEFGGAIGVVFFLAQAISVAMYVIGFTEAFVASFGESGTIQQLAELVGVSPFVLIATATNVVVFVCVFIGAGWTIKVQYLILGLLAAALASFFAGALGSFSTANLQANLQPHYEENASFFTMFALFFPAVTGIMAGANMSGDLNNPSRSIPRGTLMAVLVTAIVYLLQAILLAGSRPHEVLVSDNLVIKSIAWSPALITAGVFAATLSSALGSMMGAPRILQAFAKDRVFSWLNPFSAGSGASNEPRRATIVTFVIAQVCILLGDLNAIAPVITMFFMITYGTLNLATFYESISRNPSYRPRFRYTHWSVSLAGAIGCLAVMFLIDWVWATVSLAGMAGLHAWISKHEIEARWGDMQSGLVFERTRRNLLKLEAQLEHPKNWRPIILTLAGSAGLRTHLCVYGHYLTAGQGILTIAQIIQGDPEELAARRETHEHLLQKFIHENELEAFPVVVVAPYLTEGIESLVQCCGVGALRPNTVLLGWPTNAERAESFGANLRLISSLGRSTIAARLVHDAEGDDDPWSIPIGTVDVWWRGLDNGALMLLLAHLLTQNRRWHDRAIRVLRIVESEAARDEVGRHLNALTDAARITAEHIVVVSTDVATSIQENSRDSAITILGFEPPAPGDELTFVSGMERFVGSLPRVLFIKSAGGMRLDS